MKNNLAAFLMLTMCVLYSVQYVLPLGLGDRAVGEILEVHLLACEGVVHDEPLLSAGAEHGGGDAPWQAGDGTDGHHEADDEHVQMVAATFLERPINKN